VRFHFAGGAYTPVTKLGIVAKRAAKGAPVEEASKAAMEDQGRRPKLIPFFIFLFWLISAVKVFMKC